VSKYAAGNANAMSMNLDVFDQQDLNAWGSVVHHAFLRAIKELMEELKQDITGMNVRSKGYLVAGAKFEAFESLGARRLREYAWLPWRVVWLSHCIPSISLPSRWRTS
jgi:hypothetical protein